MASSADAGGSGSEEDMRKVEGDAGMEESDGGGEWQEAKRKNRKVTKKGNCKEGEGVVGENSGEREVMNPEDIHMTNAVSGNFRQRRLYGKPGKKFCMVCKANRDHCAVDCPGLVCRKCNLHSHWVRNCPHTVCKWCEEIGHSAVECTKGGADFHAAGRSEGKRKSEDAASGPVAKASTGSGGIGYSGAVKGKRMGDSMGFASRLSSFLASEGIMDESEYKQRKERIVAERLEAERVHNLAVAKYNKEMQAVEKEYECTAVMRTAMAQMVQLRAGVSGAATTGQVVQNTPANLGNTRPAPSAEGFSVGREESQTPLDPRGNDKDRWAEEVEMEFPSLTSVKVEREVVEEVDTVKVDPRSKDERSVREDTAMVDPASGEKGETTREDATLADPSLAGGVLIQRGLGVLSGIDRTEDELLRMEVVSEKESSPEVD